MTTRQENIACRPGTTDAMARLAAENEALRVERDELAANQTWKDNGRYPITEHHGGRVLMIRLKDASHGITHVDEITGKDYTIDLTWIRSSTRAFATTGEYSNDDIESWCEITPAQSIAHIKAQGAREALKYALCGDGFSSTLFRVDDLLAAIADMENDNESD